jgi:hypothetical protein
MNVLSLRCVVSALQLSCHCSAITTPPLPPLRRHHCATALHMLLHPRSSYAPHPQCPCTRLSNTKRRPRAAHTPRNARLTRRNCDATHASHTPPIHCPCCDHITPAPRCSPSAALSHLSQCPASVLAPHSAAPALHPCRHSRLPLRRPNAAKTLHKLSPAPRCMPLFPI